MLPFISSSDDDSSLDQTVDQTVVQGRPEVLLAWPSLYLSIINAEQGRCDPSHDVAQSMIYIIVRTLRLFYLFIYLFFSVFADIFQIKLTPPSFI